MIADENIGGATVRRTFSRGSEYLRAGTVLSADEVLAMPPNNRKALIDAGFLEVWPAAPPSGDTPERHIVPRGNGKFDVIAGKKLNEKPLTLDEAKELAA